MCCLFIPSGVAFEQGKTLPTPETVPFRLTRDMVDGMGVEGVEGVFRRSCEETLVVMRGSHEELRTIVEVLHHYYIIDLLKRKLCIPSCQILASVVWFSSLTW